MMEEHLLSICIPTYNNADCLRECLENILPQAQPYSIPIFVSDNASPDDTIGILSEFQKEYPLLYFRSNSKNLGFDQNLMKATEMASSEYVWSLGDRRRLLPNAVGKVYHTIENNRPDLLLLNNDSVSQPKTTLSADTTFHSAKDVFQNLSMNAGTLGLQILPAKAWKTKTLRKYVQDKKYSGWIHLHAIFEFLNSLTSMNVLFLAKPLVTSSNRYGHSWTDKTFQMWSTWKNSIYALPALTLETKKAVVNRTGSLGFFSIKTLLILRSKGAYNEKIFNSCQEDFLEYSVTPLGIARAISKMPMWFLRLYYESYALGRASLRKLVHSNYPLNPIHIKPGEKDIRARVIRTR